VWVWALIWMAVAGAMVMWPSAFATADLSCAQSEDAGFICFVTTSWGNPLGVGISLLFSLVPGGPTGDREPGANSNAGLLTCC
jgi:hypothetical protein